MRHLIVCISFGFWLLGSSTVAYSQTLTSGSPGALMLQRILVKINGDLITQTDLEQAQINAIRNRPIPPQSDAELELALQEITPEVLANSVDQLLLVQRGRDMGYSLSDEQFDEIIEGIKQENEMDDEQLLQALEEQQGITLAELRGVMEEQMLVGQVQQDQVLRRVKMTDTEAREYYSTHPEEFTEPATVMLREILISAPVGAGALNVARENQARVKAETALARVRGGEDFEAVVAEASDAATKANGGLIGPIALGDLAATVRARLEVLVVGDVADIERTPAGYQILKLESSTAAAPAPFDEVRASIIDNVFNERRLEALNTYLSTLRTEAIIEWKDEGLKTLYDAYIANRTSPPLSF
ncbi:MAG: peptidyl-prolyl cis-trans isomerase [Acidobacteriota bacterium]|nr:peptidyl-prolyl cis-trans isomerase [Acidobacteriota bacterium]